MEKKITAIYVMVRESELTPEDRGSYDRPLEKQKQECLEFVKNKLDADPSEVSVYTSRSVLLKDLEDGKIGRLIVRSHDRLGSDWELEGILYEFKSQSVEVLEVGG